MIRKDDWRLMGQEEYLMKSQLLHKYWKEHKPGWDHDHCEFCGEKFYRNTDLGYCTVGEYYWICETCFQDFNEMFKWEVIETLS